MSGEERGEGPPRLNMRRFFPIASLVLLYVSLSAADDPLSMELSARADAEQQIAHGQPASSVSSARPVLTAKSKTKIRIRWTIVNQEKTGNIPDVTVHFLLARDQKDSVYESALVMDFAAHAKSAADFVVEAPAAGSYVLRLETIGAARTHGHEHLAAMDLKVLP
jgi:hypothetical protein